MAQDLKKYFWIPILSLIVVILCLVVVIIVVNDCCDDTPFDESVPELILEDAHSGVWMAIDNGWTFKSDEAWTRWEGVVIQLGRFFSYTPDGDKSYKMESSWIIFENEDGDHVQLLKGDYDWINIVSDNGINLAPPLTIEEGYKLFPKDPIVSETLCDDMDKCPDKTKLPGSISDCTDELNKIPQPCARMRSLHAALEPYAIVTFWQGPDGYSMTAQQNADDHNAFTFQMPDGVALVDVFLDKVHQTTKEQAIKDLGEIARITIGKPEITPHGDMDDPPMSLMEKKPTP